MTTSGIASAIHDNTHQIPPCPKRADSSPNIDSDANSKGHVQTREKRFLLARPLSGGIERPREVASNLVMASGFPRR